MTNIIRILREPEVRDRTGLSHTGLHLLRRSGDFPHPVQIGPRAVGWIESEVNEWIEGRMAARDASE